VLESFPAKKANVSGGALGLDISSPKEWRPQSLICRKVAADRIQIDQKMIRGSLHIKDDSATPGSQVPPGTLFP